jgi:signal transduction histidine kinase
MRERAQVVGATLEVGPAEDGGWLVRWEMPVDGDER